MSQTILHIEHTAIDYDKWKTAFDSDPIGRKKSGVRRYRVARAEDDSNFVNIDLEFDSTDEAEQALAALREVWKRVEGVAITGARGRIFTVVEDEAP